MISLLKDVTGSRGENIVDLCLTEYTGLSFPLFCPGFLGDKWPAIDFYVELTSVSGSGMYFFGQAKATTGKISPKAKVLRISSKKRDIERLQKIPAPTYLFGIHEPSKRVFVRCIHAKTPLKAITSIPLKNQLTMANLQTNNIRIRMNTTDTREFVGRRGELMAELFLQDLNPFYIARNTSSDIGIDFFVGFLNSKGGLNLVAVEVKTTEQILTKRFKISKRTHDLLASSNIPGLLLIVDVKHNRFFYHVPTKVEVSLDANSVIVDIVEFTDQSVELLMEQFFTISVDTPTISAKKKFRKN
jgi:hypothetical protein